MFFQKRKPRIDEALDELKRNSASLARSIGELIPANHAVTAQQLENVENLFASDFLASARVSWAKDRFSKEVIDIMAPVVDRQFRDAFRAELRKSIPLSIVSIEGAA